MAGLGLVKQEKVELTKEELIQKFPAKKASITDEVVDLINEVNNNPDFNGNEFIDTMVDYQGAMIDCRASIPEYINAIKFCAYLETTNGSATEAYKRARAADKFVQDRINAPANSQKYNELSSAASRYRKTPLVKQILTQSEMPLYLMFQKERYKAVAVLAEEMQEAMYSKDRISAADKLLTHVKPPENIQVELGIGPTKEAVDLHTELNTQLARLAANQKAMLDAGLDIKEVQKTHINLDIIDAETD